MLSSAADQPLYILMEFAMYGSLKDYLKSVQTMKPHPEAPPPPESVYSQYLCPYHCQQILKYSGNHCYRNSNCDNTAGTYVLNLLVSHSPTIKAVY